MNQSNIGVSSRAGSPHQAPAILGLALALCLLAGCSAPVSVRTVKPAAPSEQVSAKSPLDGLLDQARNASARLERGENAALADYNFAVARLVETLEETGADPWSAPLALSGSGGMKTMRAHAPAGVTPIPSRLIPADTLSFRGKSAEHRATVAGVGAPLVAVTSFEGLGHKEFRKSLPLRNLTALVRFEGSRASLDLIDPYQVENVHFAGKRRRLGADFGAALMLGMSKARIDKLGFVRLLRPSKYDDTEILNFVQPYDPERIPVLFVHGLMSTPATWAKMYFSLIEDPAIRRRYQFWVYSYPSGYPYPHSAAQLREELDDVGREFPDHRDLVIIGHSMGGVISRLMVINPGDSIWRKAFGSPPEETDISGKSRDLLEAAAVFNHREEIDRAIFIAAPHKGSDLAANKIGQFGARLVKLPGTMATLRDSMAAAVSGDRAKAMLQRAPTSIDTLSPDNFFVRAAGGLPIVPGIPHHTIAGDRGKGDAPDSSDGLVPYWSSHIDTAASEKIVPSSHGAHEHPEGIEEVRRILLLHLRNR